ncbi:class I SAM-dependent methyltransferase [Mycolicibacterium madagascariense]|nr:class I SAM-dependent methyltransferase [Mycolicibacterium madagascariense]
MAAAEPNGTLAPPRPVTPTTILARELDELCQAVGATGADAGLLDRLRRARDLAAGLDPYLDQCTTVESADLAELASRTSAIDWTADAAGGGRLEQEMLSGHVEGQVLKFLLHLADATRVLEIGMFTGYSALAMAEQLPADGVVTACEIDEAVADVAREQFARSAAGRKITVEVGPALDTLRRLADRSEPPFDFVFIDADKAGYLGYVDFLLNSSLLGPRAVIAVDNTLMQGQPYLDGPHTANGAAIAEFNAALTDDPRVEQVVIPLRDGLTLIRRTPA